MSHAVVLVVGAGAREHALAWRLGGEPGVERVLVAPGNPLMTDVAAVRPDVPANDFAAVVTLCRREDVDLVVIGPEAPLAGGLSDALAAAGIRCAGPTAAAARLEASKTFCRAVAEAAGVPMAEGASFDVPGAALAYARRLGAPLVVKADGLAAGKGVTVCDTLAGAEQAIGEAMVGGRFGTAGRRVVVERRLDGREASLIALCDGRDALLLPPARDHKRLLDGDRGPNTGGMGACSPVDELPADEARALLARIHLPVLAEMARRGAPFTGFLYAGLMLTGDGAYLLEFNVRLGDPEAQASLPRLDAPLAQLLAAAAQGRLADAAAELGVAQTMPVRPEATVALTVASEGYPDSPRAGDAIHGIEAARSAGGLVFGGGVGRGSDGRLVTAGGRVLTVVGRGRDQDSAREAAYRAADEIDFAGRRLRRDIAAPAIATMREVAIA